MQTAGAKKCVRFAQRSRSAQEKRALLRLARTWSSLAAQTEASRPSCANWMSLLPLMTNNHTFNDRPSRVLLAYAL